MKNGRRWLYSIVLSVGLGCGCSGPSAEGESVIEVMQPLNSCAETVPANRFVDGFPSYAQCDGTLSSEIWSNNGVDTSTTSQGAGWLRTQRSGGYQCTELVWRYNHFKWGVDYRSGNAAEWCDGALPATLVKSVVPVHGDSIVFAAGVCGADATTGHIAVIDVVDNSAATVTIVEQNRASRRTVQQSCALCFLHVVANNGSTGSGGAAGMGAAGAAGTGGTANGGQASGGTGALGGASGNGPGAGAAGSAAGGATASGGTAGAGAASVAGTAGAPSSSAGNPGDGPGDLSASDDASCSAASGPRKPSSGQPLGGASLALLLGGLLASAYRRAARSSR